MYRLYYFPGACSLAVHAVLCTVGAPFEKQLVDFRKQEQRGQEYLQLNRLGRVPTLEVDGQVLTEAMAILIHLAERHPEAGLLPRDPLERAQCYRWMAYLTSTVHPYFGALWRSERYSSDPAAHATIQETVKQRLHDEFGAINEHLEGREWLLGPGPTLCDYYLFPFGRWSTAVADTRKEYPHLAAIVERLAALPGVAQAMEAEALPLFR